MCARARANGTQLVRWFFGCFVSYSRQHSTAQHSTDQRTAQYRAQHNTNAQTTLLKPSTVVRLPMWFIQPNKCGLRGHFGDRHKKESATLKCYSIHYLDSLLCFALVFFFFLHWSNTFTHVMCRICVLCVNCMMCVSFWFLCCCCFFWAKWQEFFRTQYI